MGDVTLPGFETLLDMMQWHVERWPEKPVFHFLDRENQGVTLTYRALDGQARAVAAHLAAQDAPGERVLLLYPPGPEFLTAFLGCLYAGAVAVPAYPPQPSRLERTLPRLLAIAGDSTPRFGLTTASIQPMIAHLFAGAPGLAAMAWAASDALSPSLAPSWKRPPISRGSVAFVQYTSGSTAEPRGVVLTHENLLSNLGVIRDAFEANERTRSVFWLPLYHDMGLIGGILGSVFNATETWLMSPLDFLQRPIRWLEAISRTRADTSGGPSFAYEVCVQRTTPEERAALDLSCWTLAFNGAEPVRVSVMEQFAEAFAPAGFRPEAFYPCYGLAEATLMVSGGPRMRPRSPVRFRAAALEAHRVEPAPHEAPDAVRLMSSGVVRPEVHVEIVDPETGERSPPGRIGEIWVHGPSVAGRYWNNPAGTTESLEARLPGSVRAPFLRTGDHGFLHGEELFVTGRRKDLIIHRGRNLYPQDLEYVVEDCHPALRKGCSIAFGLQRDGEEKCVVVAEVHGGGAALDPAEIRAAVAKALIRHHDVRVYDVLLLSRGGIPKTSSGKVQRGACREAYLRDTLPRWTPQASDEPPART